MEGILIEKIVFLGRKEIGKYNENVRLSETRRKLC